MACKKVHQHSILACHGGAARIKQLLSVELQKFDWQVSGSVEILDTPDSSFRAGERQLSPSELGAAVEPETLFHLHTTRDWATACSSLAQKQSKLKSTGLKPVITLHDISLLKPGDSGHVDLNDVEKYQVEFSLPEIHQHTQDDKRKALLALAPILVSPSNWLARQVKMALPEIGCRLVPNGVESNLFSYPKAREALGVAPGALVVLFAAHGGTMAQLKGAGEWRVIWAGIKAKVPNAVAFMVGGDRENRVDDLIEWPYVEHDKLQTLMAAADLLVYPSLADNHPLVVLEAMSASTAVCAYKVGGIPEQVRHGQTGVLVDPKAKEALIEECAKMLLTPGLAREMGKAGRAVYDRYFKAEDMARQYQDIYLELLSGAGS